MREKYRYLDILVIYRESRRLYGIYQYFANLSRYFGAINTVKGRSTRPVQSNRTPAKRFAR